MKRTLLFAAMALTCMSAAAQDTYENARMLGSDLNGTARYVGMGGALEALGADISTISTNPAGIGMFRRSNVSMSFGAVNQQDANKFDDLGKTNLSFDQAGFVYACRTGESSFINFAFNYHKSKNFDQILSAANRFQYEASMNKLAFAKGALESDRNGGYFLDTNNDGEWMGWRDSESNERAYPYTQMDYMYTNAFTIDDVNSPFLYTFNNGGGFSPAYAIADDYVFDRAHRGWIADYDFNLSGNVNNRFYWGLTLGIHDVNYHGFSSYVERILDGGDNYRGDMELADERWIDATGADLKLGAIFLPIENSPFRIGLSIATPTWYDVKSENATTLYNDTDPNYFNYGADKWKSSEVYEFKYYTPWKFGLSVGHTIDQYIALGASYEYSSMGSASTRVYNGHLNYYDEEDTDPDRVMNNHTDRSLKGVSLLKAGVEIKPDPSFAIRLGYNYQSPMYNKSAVRDTRLDSPSNVYSSTADYTNWKATNRITCGFGYKWEGLSLDLAYQYSNTNGTFYPFQPNVTYTDPADGSNGDNISTPTDVSFKRHQLLFTIGYTF